MSSKIEKLIAFARNDKTTNNRVEVIGKISQSEAKILLHNTGFNLLGYERIIDKFSIIHCLKSHGNSKKEKDRGQVAIIDEDFLLIPKIAKAENAIFGGKSKIGLDTIIYETVIGDCFYLVEEIRTGRKQLCLKSLRKRKPPKKFEWL